MNGPNNKTQEKLWRLAHLLSSLPSTVPDGNTYYCFEAFNPSKEDIEDYDKEEVFNHALEVTFAPGGHQKGPIIIKEQGPGLTSVVPVFEKYLT
jgi:hypothetical protein